VRISSGLLAVNDLLKNILRDRRLHRLAIAGAVLAIGLLLAAWQMGYEPSDWKGLWQSAEDALRGRPWWLFAALVILPALPVPMSALLVLTGVVWSREPVMACGITLSAMALNMSWTYWMAAVPARSLVAKFLATSGARLPELPRDNHLRLLLVLRLTPGVPFFIQNYLLGFFRVPFGTYLPLSLVCAGMVACGIVLSGAGIGGGNLKPLIAGIGLIVVGVVVVKTVRAQLAKKA
jgi:uncharacterized membrane protein YdjX (TVP38/TMEM64 family)